MFSSLRTANEGDVDLSKELVSKKAETKDEILTPMSFGLRKMEESEYSPFQSL
jgi:hypothetical protein